MKRRAFVTILFSKFALSSVVYPEALRSVIKFPQISANIKLNAGEAFLAKAGGLGLLPNRPSNGDKIYVIVDSSSVMNPCKLHAPGASICGDKDLILNSLGNFNLVYHQDSKNWQLV